MSIDSNAKATDTLLETLCNYHSKIDDEETRHMVIAALSKVIEDLEEPFDLLMRLANSANMTPLIKVGYQLGVFKALSNSPTPLTLGQLCEPTKADARLVNRVLRYLSANRFINEVDKGQFSASKMTHCLADARLEGGVNIYYGVIDPMLHELPAFLERRNYQDGVGNPCVFNAAANTDLTFYDWLKTKPEMVQDFQKMLSLQLMAISTSVRAVDWLSVIPFPKAVDPSDGPVFVDVGGNMGDRCLELLGRYPQFKGHVIVQDLEEVVKFAPAMDGAEFQGYDFFTPQPVQGARYYYLRTILHNWDDDRSVEILRNLVPALGPNSQVLIDEMAVPNTKAHIWPSVQDLLMMMTFGARERTLDDWAVLLGRAGLKIVDIKPYAPVMRTSIIFAERS
ncbi:hypothetical protein N8I77_013429 [Diaporthe amygdali]|uniref:O-methyltransferase domain-containing protein n=1 Tax=Phomopsis amygdali TaxID=1214568 RepID=A0AAD9VYX2_PHOAM|nr:hypothetical protein N8I77_013429 [Diaporthe amygdali]